MIVCINKMVQVFIVSADLVDSPIELNTKDNVTCLEIKEILSKKYNIPLQNQKISMFGQIIADYTTLTEAAYVTNPPYYVNFAKIDNVQDILTQSTLNKNLISNKTNKQNKQKKQSKRNYKDIYASNIDLIIKLKGTKRTVFIVKQLKQDLIIKVNDGFRSGSKKYSNINNKIKKHNKNKKLTKEKLDKDLDNYFERNKKLTKEDLDEDLDNYFERKDNFNDRVTMH